MPIKPFPLCPSLDDLKLQAQDLLKAHSSRNPAAAQRLREFHPRFPNANDTEIFATSLRLSDVRLTIAREHGFSSWNRFKLHVEDPESAKQLQLPCHERIKDPVFRHAVTLLDAGDLAGLRVHLTQHPHLARQRVIFEGMNYFRNPTLLMFVAANPIRHQTMPSNIVEMAQVIVEAGVDQSGLDKTLLLVATGSLVRECRFQVPLIHLLCDRGAQPTPALQAALLHGELEAVAALIACGGRITFPVAAGLGRIQDFDRLLPAATHEERHLAFTMAADRGHLEIVKRLLNAGEEIDRYNPIGGHAHTTPLHQAAWRGHQEVVHLLIDRGARLDIKDLLWDGTPADWAHHGGKTQIETYLRSQMKT